MSAAVNEIKYSSINTIDELLISRVKTGLNASLFAYPATLRGKSDYISYTAKDLDRFADKAARKFASLSLIPEHSSATEAEVVAILAPSGLGYVVSIFALSRMGFAILFLPNRLSTEAYINLLQKAKCRKLVAGSSNAGAAELIQDQYLLSVFPYWKGTEKIPRSHLDSLSKHFISEYLQSYCIYYPFVRLEYI
ncbi:uncharacterized protein K441DRAFT_595033 [Cenococcum geophilum 1.58]|uniref:Uncharacterized protein n=1 Tax=Cenococcum geophilum 1.58 TaxID=794803 RepID=A0ACC8ELH7_9PEZI|nr:hypothetical protein K441DRAFT_595033 [Cenococcum geophilum 1.58]